MFLATLNSVSVLTLLHTGYCIPLGLKNQALQTSRQTVYKMSHLLKLHKYIQVIFDPIRRKMYLEFKILRATLWNSSVFAFCRCTIILEQTIWL
jgi:hypothetical protein